MPNLSIFEGDRATADPNLDQAVQASRRGGERRLALWSAVLLVLPLAAQTAAVPFGHSGGQPGNVEDAASGIETAMQAKRITQLNQIRQKSIVSDAEKLVRLAQELNDDANADGANLSQAERMRKASEIEKLAKSVKEKMTYAIGEPTEISLPFSTSAR
jgi:hypothetical protein